MSNRKHDGFKSRKFIFSIFSIVTIFAGAIIAAKIEGMSPLYATMVGGVIGVVAAYLTGNVAERFTEKKKEESTSQQQKDLSKEE